MASLARQHNNANVICLGARFLTEEQATEMVDIFLTTEFEGGRHERRVDKIHSLTSC
jgi:ribose 5-phosphate isomerase B